MSTISTCSVSPQLSMIPQDKDSGRQKPYVNAYEGRGGDRAPHRQALIVARDPLLTSPFQGEELPRSSQTL